MTKQPTISNHASIHVDQIGTVLNIVAGAKHNALFLSLPGVGKTAEISLWAEQQGAELIVEVASLLDRLDLAGLPFLDQAEGALAGIDKQTKFAPNSKIAQLSKEHNPNGGKVVVYFNEFNSAPESVYPVLYRLLNERAIGDLHIRENVTFCADGNPASAQSAGRNLQEALKRRFAVFNVETNFPVWERWAVNHNIDGRIIAFLGYNAQFLNDFDGTKRHRLTYACPASWEKFSSVVAPIFDLADENLRLASTSAFIGAEAGAQFTAYMSNYAKLPDIDKLLAEPKKSALPQSADVLWLTIGTIYNRVTENGKLLDAALTIAGRLIDDQADFGVFMLRSMARNTTLQKRVNQSPVFMKELMPKLTQRPDLCDAIFAASDKAKN